MTDDEFVADALDRWEDEFERGHDVPAAELCRERPHLADRVNDDIATLRRVDHAMRLSDVLQRDPSSGYEAGDIIAGRFRLEERIGYGAQGEVWRGTNQLNGQTLAVKVAPVGSVPPGKVPPLVVESRRSSRLDHRNIVPVYYDGRAGDSYYVVSRLIVGETLRQRIVRDRPGVEEAVRIAGELAAALAYSHGRGVVHRDIKPENVLLDRDGRAYVTDFGIAIGLGERGARSGGTGTAQYMAPEQHDPRGTLDGRCDIYAVGVILYEMLTGRHPFSTAEGAAQLARLEGRRPPPASTWNPGVPRNLDEIVGRCLAARPADRFESAVELGAILRGEEPTTFTDDHQLRVGSWQSRMGHLRRLCEAGPIPAEALAAVVALLDPENTEDREKVVRAIVREGAAAVPPLTAALREEPADGADFHRAVVFALERIGPAASSAVPLLKTLEKVPELQVGVRRALEAIRPPVGLGWKLVLVALLVVIAACAPLYFLELGVPAAAVVSPREARVAVAAVVAAAMGVGLAVVRERRVLLPFAVIVAVGAALAVGIALSFESALSPVIGPLEQSLGTR